MMKKVLAALLSILLSVGMFAAILTLSYAAGGNVGPRPNTYDDPATGIYVSPDGNDATATGSIDAPYKSINTALAAASPGDTIVLRGGTYQEGINVRVRIADITIKSAKGEWAIIDLTTFDPGHDDDSGVWFYPGSSGGKLQAVEVMGGFYAVCIDTEWDWVEPGFPPGPGVSNVIIEDCILHDSRYDVVKVKPNCNDIIIRYNEIYNSGQAFTPPFNGEDNAEGIDNVNGDRMLVQNNYIHDICSNAIYAKGGATNVIIENNIVECAYGAGIMLGFDTSPDFFDLDANPNYYENIGGIVRNNLIIDTGWEGIGLYAAKDAQVYNNTLVNVGNGEFSRSAIYFGIATQDWDNVDGCPPSINPNIHNNLISQPSSFTNQMIGIRYITDFHFYPTDIYGDLSALDGMPTMNNNSYYTDGKSAAFTDNRPSSPLSNAGLAAWQAHISGDTGSLEADPTLDADYMPTNPLCSDMGLLYPLIVGAGALSTDKDITAFTLAGESATITGTSISVTVPYGTDVTSLTPAVTHTGASYAPTGAQDFSSSVTYTVTAADSTTKAYAVTVTVAPPPTYSLTVTAGAGGDVSGTTTGSYTETTAISVTATPDTDFHFTEWTISGASITGGNSANPATFAMPAGSVTLTANFEADTVPVTLSSIAVTAGPTKTTYIEGELLDLSGLVVTATYSDSSTANVTSLVSTVPTAGTALDTVGSQSIAVSYTEDSITRSIYFSVTVTAAPPAPVYSISLSIIGTHAFTPAVSGYTAQTGIPVIVSNTGNQPTGALDVTLSGTDAAAFELNAATLASIAVSGTDGFEVAPVTGLTTGTYTATITVSGGFGISEDFVVSFTVADVPTFSLTANAGSGGTLYGTATGYYEEDAAISVTAIADPGSHFTDWTISGASITDGNTANPATFSMPAGAVVLTANFEADAPPVTLESIAVTAGPTKTTYIQGELLDLTGLVVTATYSDSSTANVTSLVSTVPTAGTALDTVGSQVITVSYTQSSITRTTTFSVSVTTAAPPTYSLTATAGAGGTVSGTVTGSYPAGTAISVTAIADPGSHFTDWTISGASITGGDTANPATFSMPAGVVVLTANFEADAPPKKPVTGITVTGASGATSIDTWGGTLQLSATVVPTDAWDKAVTWSIESGSEFASVNSGGRVTALDNGTVVIRATAQDGSGVYGEITLTITGQEEVIVPLIYTTLTNFGTWTGSGTVSGKVDADASKFGRLTLNGNVVNPANYTVTSGSTIITLKESYLKALANGSYIYIAEFSDGYSEYIRLTVSVLGNTNTNTGGSGTGAQTGDEFNQQALLGFGTLLVSTVSALLLMFLRAYRSRSNRQ
ncbi:MAG: right-handed parallel beta-helix repeat-containing protein [Coriobacteriia bacterium]|nr:right-handed parallel beta-helix repeat-containing protein [Coriobacteriia bacterium]